MPGIEEDAVKKLIEESKKPNSAGPFGWGIFFLMSTGVITLGSGITSSTQNGGTQGHGSTYLQEQITANRLHAREDLADFIQAHSRAHQRIIEETRQLENQIDKCRQQLYERGPWNNRNGGADG